MHAKIARDLFDVDEVMHVLRFSKQLVCLVGFERSPVAEHVIERLGSPAEGIKIHIEVEDTFGVDDERSTTLFNCRNVKSTIGCTSEGRRRCPGRAMVVFATDSSADVSTKFDIVAADGRLRRDEGAAPDNSLRAVYKWEPDCSELLSPRRWIAQRAILETCERLDRLERSAALAEGGGLAMDTRFSL